MVVGDLHGDLSKARDALQIAGVLSSDGKDQWVGEDTVCPFFSSLTNIDLEHNFSFCCLLVQRLRPSLNRDVYGIITMLVSKATCCNQSVSKLQSYYFMSFNFQVLLSSSKFQLM